MVRLLRSARLPVGAVLAIAASFFACSDAVAPSPQETESLPPREDGKPQTDGDASVDAAPPEPQDGGDGGDGDAGDGGGGGFTYTPVPTGCVNSVSAGNHVYTCGARRVDATIPDMFATCPPAGCGLILSLHGDTGSGLTMDAHTTLRERGAPRGYIVVAPTGPAVGTINGVAYPGYTWGATQDADLIAIVRTFMTVFKPDPKRIHVAGFSRGGYTAWRFACDQSNLFASIAVGGAGNAAVALDGGAEATCFEDGRAPTRRLDLLMLMGQLDSRYPRMASMRDNALTNYTLGLGDRTIVKNAGYTHYRAQKAGVPTVEWINHPYQTDPTAIPLWADMKGHCIPGSKVPKNAAFYAIACKPPTALDWGAEILTFFDAHPRP